MIVGMDVVEGVADSVNDLKPNVTAPVVPNLGAELSDVVLLVVEETAEGALPFPNPNENVLEDTLVGLNALAPNTLSVEAGTATAPGLASPQHTHFTSVPLLLTQHDEQSQVREDVAEGALF